MLHNIAMVSIWVLNLLTIGGQSDVEEVRVELVVSLTVPAVPGYTAPRSFDALEIEISDIEFPQPLGPADNLRHPLRLKDGSLIWVDIWYLQTNGDTDSAIELLDLTSLCERSYAVSRGSDEC